MRRRFSCTLGLDREFMDIGREDRAHTNCRVSAFWLIEDRDTAFHNSGDWECKPILSGRCVSAGSPVLRAAEIPSEWRE